MGYSEIFNRHFFVDYNRQKMSIEKFVDNTKQRTGRFGYFLDL